uniref:Uncharacterized protein n=1 Tax=Nelumbo nucifera TaxID=4432 RepID=A0A822XQR7_NELNU|nr:TPA_asm: hypothetical protein HUJ06_024223 [Nelumbo nucifera]
MKFEKEYLDLFLVPTGLWIMFSYHLFLLYRVLRYPQTTVIGYENHNKMAWVERMMQTETRDLGSALAVISNNTTAATFLGSMCITLSSLIGTWVAGSAQNIFVSRLIFGDTSQTTMSMKYISLLSFFLVAFVSFVQSARGSNFWSLGLRALYFAIILLLWIFGPIPMFAASVIMVLFLHVVDTNSLPLHQYGKPPLGQRMLGR